MSTLQLVKEAQFHGANRLHDKEARLWWIPAMLLLLGTAMAVVCLTVYRYLESPTYIVHKESLQHSVEFPAVVICPEIIYSEEKIDQFLSEIKFPAGLNTSYVREILPQMAAFYAPDMKYRLSDLEVIERLLEYNRMDVETAAVRLTATCEETLIKCRWNKEMKDCSELFRMELTPDGFCCVFNSRSLRSEMEDYGSAMLAKRTKWYTKRFGFSSGLMLAVNQTQKPLNVDLAYKWIALHTNGHFVDTTVNGTALNPGSEQWVAFYTRSIRIAEFTKAFSIKIRKCKMPDERLTYFPIYNRRYCILECEIANTLNNCQCVRIVHPQPPGTSRCRASSLLCAKHAMVSVGSFSCRCPQTCDVESETIQTSSFMLTHNTDNTLDEFYKDLDFDKVTVVRTFVQKRLKKTMERWSYYGYLDLFAQLGGVFNVFFGCSVLTILGLLHLTWRVFGRLLLFFYK